MGNVQMTVILVIPVEIVPIKEAHLSMFLMYYQLVISYHNFKNLCQVSKKIKIDHFH